MDQARTAIVTGGSSGIGLATGAELVRRGYDVVLTARTEDRLRAAAADVGARAVAADCADPDCSGLTCGDAGVCSNGTCG